MKYLLDTNICIYALKNRPPEVLQRLAAVGRAAVALSVITVLELRHGAEKSQQREATLARLEFFLRPMAVLPPLPPPAAMRTPGISRRSGITVSLRKRTGWRRKTAWSSQREPTNSA